MKSTAPWLFAALAVAAVAWFFLTRGGEEGRIRKELGKLQEIIEKADGESQLVGVDKARRLGELFTREFKVDVVPYGRSLTDRSSLSRTFLGYRAQSPRIGLDFRAESLDVDVEQRRAVHELEALVTGDGGRREGYRLRIEWAEENGEWRIRLFEVLEILEGTPLW